MLILATFDMSTAETWYMHGTFYASPSYFYQLYTIHAMIDGYMCSLVYVLLQNKQQTMYTRCDSDSVPVSKFKDYVTKQLVEGDRRSWNLLRE